MPSAPPYSEGGIYFMVSQTKKTHHYDAPFLFFLIMPKNRKVGLTSTVSDFTTPATHGNSFHYDSPSLACLRAQKGVRKRIS